MYSKQEFRDGENVLIFRNTCLLKNAIYEDIIKKQEEKLPEWKKRKIEIRKEAIIVRFKMKLEILNDASWKRFVEESGDLLKSLESYILFTLDESLLYLINYESKSVLAIYVCSEKNLEILMPIYELISGIRSSQNESYGKLIKHYFQTYETLQFIESENKWYFVVKLSISMRYEDNFSIENSKILQKRTTYGKNLVSELMHYAFPCTPKSQNSINPALFYDNIHGVPESETSVSISPHEINANLLPFQKKALGWMLKREKHLLDMSDSVNSSIPPTWEVSVDADGKQVYYNKIYGIICSNITDVKNTFKDVSGGILADEMGLGKTVEMIALILKNKREEIPKYKVFDPYAEKHVVASKTTLIITPSSILQQWITEFSKFAPHLKILHYFGLKNSPLEPSIEYLIEYDVIITSYNILSSEIHHTKLMPERSLRHNKKYIPKLSPLVQIQFWRICVDEAQMIETGVSNASLTALCIPRVHAWCITGTPVRNSLSDLYGLLVFLRLYPFNYSKIWKRLINDSRNTSAFISLFSSITCRHTKKYIGDQIVFPKQEKTILLLDFTPIEEHNYSFLLKQALEDIGFNDQKDPINLNWNFDDFKDKMKQWLLRLRQTCCHMQVGSINKMNLGDQLMMLSEALDAMIKKFCDTNDNNERLLYTSKFTIGRLYEGKKEPQKALDIWLPILEITQNKINMLEQKIEKIKQNNSLYLKDDLQESIHMKNEDSVCNYNNVEEKKASIKFIQTHLRHWLSLAHRLTFFIGTAYFQLGNKDKEDEYYKKAEQIRREILLETESKAIFLMNKLSEKAKNNKFTNIPKLNISEFIENIHSNHIIKSLGDLIKKLNDQTEKITEWRQKVIDLSLSDLVDHNKEDINGEEYIKSLDIMEDAYQYQEALRSAVASRVETITGQKSLLTIVETQARLASKQTQLKLQLAIVTEELRPKSNLSLKSIINNLRLPKQINDINGGNKKISQEKDSSNLEVYFLSEFLKSQTKISFNLEKEISDLSYVHNARIEYYRQLQIISDYVAELDETLLEPQNYIKKMNELNEKIKNLESIIFSNQGSLRYLKHLRKTSQNASEMDKTCVICQNIFNFGILTKCGHIFCKSCITQWLSEHRTCPSCKTETKRKDCYNIAYNDSKMNNKYEESNVYFLNYEDSKEKCSKINNEMFLEIKNIKLKKSYGAKVDMIIKHLLWIRKRNPSTPKSVIFSQWKEMLDILQHAFNNNGIKYTRLDKITANYKKKTMENDPVEKFKNDHSIEVFMLHARSQSAGLTLTNATNVFLCEPLINTAIELQAVNRVHRIGQNKQTYVWLYVIKGTVEEKIIKLVEEKKQNFTKIHSNILDSSYNVSNFNNLVEKELQKNIHKLVNTTGEIIENDILLYLWGK
ncbi:E3 ubiquitin-protein ligase IRC20 [Pneumocystis jirovecii RU7]|uniref:RING-type domain-containing protein n=1 Tax=Pneumocystis jirovecii (strain RU7) TaxID=1408657 RepID=A0A0W4ZNQ0_PNEJ7|nr:E3 ubiquitin-protein ligase IRC20 [Pneumocystis jirovecii RU7]KTW30000.1 hypothetical protein T551_01944 [Pneumocystis jirovecii RU7]